MSRGLRIAVVKPDWGIRGGAEHVIDRLVAFLGDDGHDVTPRFIPVADLPRTVYRMVVPDRVWDGAPEYFRYLALLDAVSHVDVGDADLVLTTQPPSFAVDHPHHLSIFYHHLRVFYDLEAAYLAAGFVTDRTVHDAARDHVRHLDQSRLERVTQFLAPPVTARRLARFNGIDGVEVFHAGVDFDRSAEPSSGAVAPPTSGAVLCVSRSEFSKRTELFVHAMKYLAPTPATLIGSGGRLRWVQHLDEVLSAPGAELDAVTPADLWCNPGRAPRRMRHRRALRSNVDFAGRVDGPTLGRAYRRATCVVAPALDEDYGLTAIEAMAVGRPVICCHDGGGLAEIVTDGVDGLVVEPTGRAIADAVESLLADPGRACAMGAAAREKAAGYSWKRAREELRRAVDQVMA